MKNIRNIHVLIMVFLVALSVATITYFIYKPQFSAFDNEITEDEINRLLEKQSVEDILSDVSDMKQFQYSTLYKLKDKIEYFDNDTTIAGGLVFYYSAENRKKDKAVAVEARELIGTLNEGSFFMIPCPLTDKHLNQTSFSKLPAFELYSRFDISTENKPPQNTKALMKIGKWYSPASVDDLHQVFVGDLRYIILPNIYEIIHDEKNRYIKLNKNRKEMKIY